MRRRLTLLMLALCLLVTFTPLYASATPRVGATRVISLGTAVDHGRLVQGYAFVHGRARGAVKPPRPPRTDPLYTFLAKGAKWRTVEDYVVNPANDDGVSASMVSDALRDGVAAWQEQVTPTIFGVGSVTNDALASDWVQPDGLNEVYFSSSELDQNTVAVTIVWGIFGGPPAGRELTEWDMVFNDALQEPWGDAVRDSANWDVLDIATHELGHSAGLGDLYSTSATEQTMYGYASPGEIKKRTLEAGDIAGIQTLYQ